MFQETIGTFFLFSHFQQKKNTCPQLSCDICQILVGSSLNVIDYTALKSSNE